MTDALTFDDVSVAANGPILDGVSFSIKHGEAFGLVGESGCGKSTVALAAMRYLAPGMKITKGRILIEGKDISKASDAEIRSMRGSRIAMVYQDPMASLNPVMTIGRQLIEVPMLHGETDEKRAQARAVEMLNEVRLPDPELMMNRYPFQLSGGQQQRVVIAMALMAEPALLVMDEPTTGLDVTIEAAILDLVKALRVKFGTAILFISHNLGTVARLCDRMGVLYAGRLVETGTARAIFKTPAHPYSRGLLAALPRLDSDRHSNRLSPIEGSIMVADRMRKGCAFAPRCQFAVAATCIDQAVPVVPVAGDATHLARCARLDALPPPDAKVLTQAVAAVAQEAGTTLLDVKQLTKHYATGGAFSRSTAVVRAMSEVNIAVSRSETLAIVGESGSGKSTLARVLSGLTEATDGSAELGGSDVAQMPVGKRSPDLRRRMQMVFQNPDSTLNPSHTVEFALSRPLRLLRGLKGQDLRDEVTRLIERVRLNPDLLKRKPHQLSGGQRQRVALARALAGGPDLVIADEPVSALDVSVQAAIVNLLDDVQTSTRIGLILISHDLALVRHMADRVAVMYLGRIVEQGPAAQVFAPPHHPYTEALLAAAPQPDPDAPPPSILLSGTMPSPTSRMIGCAFASRCRSKIDGLCDTTPPPRKVFGSGHTIDCHLDLPAAT